MFCESCLFIPNFLYIFYFTLKYLCPIGESRNMVIAIQIRFLEIWSVFYNSFTSIRGPALHDSLEPWLKLESWSRFHLQASKYAESSRFWKIESLVVTPTKSQQYLGPTWAFKNLTFTISSKSRIPIFFIELLGLKFPTFKPAKN